MSKKLKKELKRILAALGIFLAIVIAEKNPSGSLCLRSQMERNSPFPDPVCDRRL